MIEVIQIKNYKSIEDISLKLNKINVLIGSNGAGKSNFISFFELIKSILNQKLGQYTLEKGGIDTLLHHGRKVSESFYGLLDFDNTNALSFRISPTQQNKGYIEFLKDYYNGHKDTAKNYYLWHSKDWDNAVEESNLINETELRASYLQGHLSSFTVYHFHDTSSQSPMRNSCDINDNQSLKSNGSNLAAYLYKLSINDSKSFKLIEATIRSIAPYFKRFILRPNPLSANSIQLEWEEVDSDMYLNGHSFSDGTLRFIALATLLLQRDLPKTIIIDEPELGLHPAAITKFAAMVNRAANESQIIISTQSVNIVNCFGVDDIITVDRKGGASLFKRLSDTDLTVWIDEYQYSLSELWEKNVIGGQL